MKMKTIQLMMLLAMAVAVATPRVEGARKKQTSSAPPDFTRENPLKADKDVQDWKHWAMGPTGARVWVWADRKTIVSDGATQICVIKLDANSPASGKLEAGDVILGAAGGKPPAPFVKNARSEVAQAITDAEIEENKGQLNLLVWRMGNTSTVTLTLPVMGAFSTTSPAHCEKTRNVVDQIATRIVKGRLKETGIPDYVNALGLLATGEEKYLPALKTFAHDIAPPGTKVELSEIQTWVLAYKMIFLAEYYAATKDDHVLPALTEIATKMAMGRSSVGTWGHRIGGVVSSPWSNGGASFRVASGYGGMNSVGIPVTIGLVLAQKCGIRNKEIDEAVRVSADFLRYFAEKGCVPYGDHEPYMGSFDDNGKNSMAAVLFDLLGEKEVASYFTAMTMASVREREDGHTGPYFSIVWGGLGAACGGEEATGAYMKDMRWYYELMRQPGGVARYQPVLCGGQEMGAYGKSPTWSTAGAALMHYCAPRKKIYLTGKGGRTNPPMAEAQIHDCLRVCLKNFYKDCTADELIKLLEHRLPVTRRRAAVELGNRTEDVVPQLIAMLDSPDRNARYGACEGLRYAGRNSADAADALIAKALASDDYTLRYYGVLAFGKPNDSQGFGSMAKRAGPALLKLAATDDLKSDPMRKLQATVAMVLTYSGSAKKFAGVYPNGKGLETMDRNLLYPAIRSFFTNPNGGAREAGSDICGILKENELEELWEDVYQAALGQAPSGDQFAGGARKDGLALLVKYRFKEGMDVIMHNIRNPRHGTRTFNPILVDMLKAYGTHAKPLVPVIRETIRSKISEKQAGDAYFEDLEKKYRAIETSTETPELRSIAQDRKPGTR
jgi:Family of unknown function (DUF6288)/HEAT repeats